MASCFHNVIKSGRFRFGMVCSWKGHNPLYRKRFVYEMTINVHDRTGLHIKPQASHHVMCAITNENFLVDKIPVTDEQKQSLLDLVDCSCLSECTLQRAYTSELVPQTHVTKAALELCGRLRHELDDAKQVIRYQEAELDKYGLGAKYRTGEYPTIHRVS